MPGGTLGRFEIVRGTGAIAQRGGAGANLLARRSAFDVVGAWDEYIGPGSVVPACEEFDIFYRALARGLTVARVPSIEVLHWGGRRFDDGSADRLLNAYFYGEGAVIGKHLRIDPRMVAPAVRMAAADLYQLAMSVAYDHGRGAHAYAERWRGIASGITTPVDRDRGVFAAAPTRSQSPSRRWRKNARVSASERPS